MKAAISDIARRYGAKDKHMDDPHWLQQSKSQLSHLQLSWDQTEHEGILTGWSMMSFCDKRLVLLLKYTIIATIEGVTFENFKDL